MVTDRTLVAAGAGPRVGAADKGADNAKRVRQLSAKARADERRSQQAAGLAGSGQQPLLLLLDEVTSFLDVPRRVAFFALLGELAEQRRYAIVISTHELELALRCANRLTGRTKGGMNTKLHDVADASGRPTSFFMTAGQVTLTAD